MIDKIKQIIHKSGINTYLIAEEHVETIELFFIKRVLDMRRMKEVKKYTVTLYRDFTKDGQKMRGSATAYLYANMNDEEIEQIIEDTYFAASFVNNPYYEIPKGQKEDKVLVHSELAHLSLEESAALMTRALYKEDIEEEVFINSAELFITRRNKCIVSSEGSDVSYENYTVQGEFISQCTAPQDVEQYEDFYYEDLNIEALSSKVKSSLEYTLARAKAELTPELGKIKVILTGRQVKTLLSYYVDRSSSSMIYAKHSAFKIGEAVQGNAIIGDSINIILKASVPYTEEGIRQIDHELVENGVLRSIHGSSQFSYYLGIEPIGTYTNIQVRSGNQTLEEMKQEPYIEVISFSDFQMDATTGYFGGEIRLAFYYNGEEIIPVTGGSISGNIRENQGELYFSKEMLVEKGYRGPTAVTLNHAAITGAVS